MIKSLIIFAAMAVSIGASAHSKHVTGPLWTCSLSAHKVSGMNIGLFLSAGGLETGNAIITCQQPGKAPVRQRAAVIMSQLGIGAGLTFYHSLELRSVAIGLVNPNDLFGKRKIGVKAGVNLFRVEGGILIQTRIQNGVSLDVGLYGSKALGLGVNLQGVYLEILTQKQYAQVLRDRQQAQDRFQANNN